MLSKFGEAMERRMSKKVDISFFQEPLTEGNSPTKSGRYGRWYIPPK